MNVPPTGDVGERLAALAGQRPGWPLAEPTPRWIRVRIGDELVADSCRALLHVQYGRGPLPATVRRRAAGFDSLGSTPSPGSR